MFEQVESIVLSPQDWPSVGTKSSDDSAVIGHNFETYLFQGSNKHFDAYFLDPPDGICDEWVNLFSNRHKKFDLKGVKVLSVVVPNKATCVPWNFPLSIPTGGTVLFKNLKKSVKTDFRLICPLEKLEFSDSDVVGAFSRTDSHWSRSGCLLVFNELLENLGLPSLDTSIAAKHEIFAGDLSDKWHPNLLSEFRKDLYSPELVSIFPKLVADNGTALRGHMGRHVIWENKFAKHELRVTLIGQSSSGPGFSSRELTWWFSRVFKSVTFIHMAECPTDILDVAPCDILIFQTVERFLHIAPKDNLSFDQLMDYAKGL